MAKSQIDSLIEALQFIKEKGVISANPCIRIETKIKIFKGDQWVNSYGCPFNVDWHTGFGDYITFSSDCIPKSDIKSGSSFCTTDSKMVYDETNKSLTIYKKPYKIILT